jgi:hypothetical protein
MGRGEVERVAGSGHQPAGDDEQTAGDVRLVGVSRVKSAIASTDLERMSFAAAAATCSSAADQRLPVGAGRA